MTELSCTSKELVDFVVESNRIEGITGKSFVVHSAWFLARDEPTVDDICTFVKNEAGAKLRNQPDMNVWIGSHIAPLGGPEIFIKLRGLVELAVNNDATPFDIHAHYETLHPFMDGNGRSGRILWAWQMIYHNIRPGLSLGFLHAFYYQTLAAYQGQPNA